MRRGRRAILLLRVPAQSNPSWVDVAQLAALHELLPRWPARPR